MLVSRINTSCWLSIVRFLLLIEIYHELFAKPMRFLRAAFWIGLNDDADNGSWVSYFVCAFLKIEQNKEDSNWTHPRLFKLISIWTHNPHGLSVSRFLRIYCRSKMFQGVLFEFAKWFHGSLVDFANSSGPRLYLIWKIVWNSTWFPWLCLNSLKIPDLSRYFARYRRIQELPRLGGIRTNAALVAHCEMPPWLPASC